MAEPIIRLRSRDPGIENPNIARYEEDVTDPRSQYYSTEGYQFAGSARPGVASDDTMPLFLSDYPDEYESQDFEQSWQKKRKVNVWSRIFASVLAAASIAVLYAALSADATRAVVANASASIASVLPGQSAPAQTAPTQLTARDIQLKDPARLAAPANQTTTAVAPTRGELTMAYQNTLTNQTPAAAVPAAAPPAAAPPVAAPPARRLDVDELAGLMKRAKSLIAAGDIAPARLLLERAADAQEANAALLLAQTYDPAVLGKADERSITPDPAMARSWYQKATRLGSADAQQRLSQMQN